jgi:hypothetical protein
VLTLDADELLVYPMSERVGLHRLTRFLDQVQAEGLVTFMLDMYSRRSEDQLRAGSCFSVYLLRATPIIRKTPTVYRSGAARGIGSSGRAAIALSPRQC